PPRTAGRPPPPQPRPARPQHARPAAGGDVDPHDADGVRLQPLPARGLRRLLAPGQAGAPGGAGEGARDKKPERGTLQMRATHRGGSVIIEVSDDGRGLDRERIIAKGRELGMPSDDSWSDVQVWDLVFEAGFSTA